MLLQYAAIAAFVIITALVGFIAIGLGMDALSVAIGIGAAVLALLTYCKYAPGAVLRPISP